MLSVREEIKQKDINACHWLIPEKKIILLTGRTSSEKLVIKPEDTSGNRVPNAAQNMRYRFENARIEVC